MNKIIIVGAGGFGREAAWVIDRSNAVNPTYELLGFCDDDSEYCMTHYGSSYLGTLEEVAEGYSGVSFFCAIGKNRIRQSVTKHLTESGLAMVTVIDPSAVIAPDVTVGDGSFIGIGSVISVSTKIGSGVIINHNVTVGHDVTVDDFAQLCPGVSLSGSCHVGEGALLGSNSATVQERKIGAWSTLGIGAVLLSDLEDGQSRVRLR